MTEKEANKKLCPIQPKDSETSYCMADRCAVWVWDYRNSTVGELPKSEWRGHCGLIRQ
jgi:poly(3-hydroxyalkanoate) synthetase